MTSVRCKPTVSRSLRNVRARVMVWGSQSRPRWLLRHGLIAVLLWEIGCAAIGLPVGVKAGLAMLAALQQGHP